MNRMVLLPRNGMVTVVSARLKNDRQNKKSLIISDFSRLFCDPFGARTQDPNIKSVVLYRLS